MKKFIAALMVIVVLFTVTMPKKYASADALTASMVAASAYTVGASMGIEFTSAGWTAAGAKSMLERELDSYLAGRTIAQVFGTETIKAVAGKIAIGHMLYNQVLQFLRTLSSKYNLGTNRVGMGFMFSDDYLAMNADAQDYLNGWEMTFNNSGMYWVATWVNVDGSTVGTSRNDVQVALYPLTPEVSYTLATNGNGINCYIIYKNAGGSTKIKNYGLGWSSIYPDVADRPVRVYGTDNGTINSAINLSPGYQWEGDLGLDNDTNIEQLIPEVFSEAASGNLDVIGEVTETGSLEPQPTPAPTYPPVDDVNQGLGDIVGGLNDLIGTQQGVLEGVNDIAGTLEGAQEAVEGIQEGIGSISEALEVPTASEAPTFKFDLTTLFPFCIPFDIYRFVTMFSSSPVAPHVQIPFNIPAVGLQYTFDLDFSSFDSVASVLRSVELIAFCVGLAILTSKVIRW